MVYATVVTLGVAMIAWLMRTGDLDAIQAPVSSATRARLPGCQGVVGWQRWESYGAEVQAARPCTKTILAERESV